MKKALIITTISGFLPQFELNDVKILQSQGYEIHYASNFNNPVYSFDENLLRENGIKLHHIEIEKSPTRINHNIKAMKQIKQIIDAEKIDLVHCHNPLGSVAGRMAASVSKQKPCVIYTAHGFHFYSGAPLVNWLIYYPVEKYLAKKTDVIITINDEDYNRAKKFKLKKGGSVYRIHGVGVDLERFRKKEEIKAEKRCELGIPEGSFHIVTAAELNVNKNQKVIIEAIAALNKKDIYYSICGKGQNAEKLQEVIREKNLEEQVKLLGFRTDMDEILQTADCFAFPSIREGLGIAAVEALGTEIPLIVADNRGTREYARDDYNSIVCHADSVEEFKCAIDKLYTCVAYREQLATHCREMAERFSTRATNDKMQVIYKEVDKKIEARG